MEKRESVGGIWKGTTKKGDPVHNIRLEYAKLEPDEKGFVKLQAFKNDFKKDNTHPDYRILPRSAATEGGGYPKKEAKPKPKAEASFDDFGGF